MLLSLIFSDLISSIPKITQKPNPDMHFFTINKKTGTESKSVPAFDEFIKFPPFSPRLAGIGELGGIC